jgi:glycosyltransferase involved in cell wall biosynthesis
MTMPLVSIVTVSYNQEEFLEAAIKSVLNQTYPNIEYIIFDGGSTDNSAEIINRYRDRFAYMNIGPDGGAPAALNAGFRIATGTIHAFLNSDDILCPWAVETWIETFKSNPGTSVVFGDIEIIDQHGRPGHLPGRKVSTFLAPPYSPRRYAAGASVIPQQASAWTSSVFERVGGFREDNASCWDYEFFVDATLQGFYFKQISGVLAKFRVHDNSISGTGKHNERRIIDHSRIQEKWLSANYIIHPLERFLLLKSAQFIRAGRYLMRKFSKESNCG